MSFCWRWRSTLLKAEFANQTNQWPGWSIDIKGSASARSVTAMIWLLASLGVIALGILVVYATGFSVWADHLRRGLHLIVLPCQAKHSATHSGHSPVKKKYQRISIRLFWVFIGQMDRIWHHNQHAQTVDQITGRFTITKIYNQHRIFPSALKESWQRIKAWKTAECLACLQTCKRQYPTPRASQSSK